MIKTNLSLVLKKNLFGKKMNQPSTNQRNQSFLPNNPEKGRAFLPFTFCLVSFLLLILSGCGDSFQPFQENDRYFFSIYGYLDASVDTQWVRVGPAREQIDMAPEKPEMSVTLNHQQSGNIVVMHDSLLQIASDNILNTWTVMDIEPGHTYTLQAERPDGKASRVSVTLPEDFPTPRLRRETDGFPAEITYSLFVDEVDHLADVQSRWYIRIVAPGGFEDHQMFSFSYREKAETVFTGGYRVPITPEEEEDQIMSEVITPPDGQIQVLHRQVFVAVGGPEWNEDIASMSDLAYTLPEGLSNIENGVGYMVGVVSKSIPLESCYNERRQLIACPEEKPFW